MTTYTPYDIIASTYKKNFTPTDREISKINSFNLLRTFSTIQRMIPYLHIINVNSSIPLNAQYWMCRALANDFSMFKLPKKEDFVLDEYEEIVRKHYGVSYEVAKQYCKILPKSEKEKILSLYKGGKS